MKKFIIYIFVFSLFIPSYVHAVPHVDLLPGMTETQFDNEGKMNPIRLLKVDGRLYFFNLGRQTGIHLDIYDSSMNLLKHVTIGEMTHQGVRIYYNELKKEFSVFWTDYDETGLSAFYRFVDLDGNMLNERVKLGLDAKIGSKPVETNKSPTMAYDQNGNYIVTWTGQRKVNTSDLSSCVFVQKIGSDLALQETPVSIHPCSDQTVALNGQVFYVHDKYFIYWTIKEVNQTDVSTSNNVYRPYYTIFGPDEIKSHNGTQLNEDIFNEQYAISEIMADQNNVYYFVEGKRKKSHLADAPYKLVKFDVASETYSSMYEVGSTYWFNRNSVIKNNKIFFLGYWSNWSRELEEKEITRYYLVIFDLLTNKAHWTKLIDEYAFNNIKLWLGGVDNGNMYFLRTYEEVQYSEPTYAYITTFPEALIYQTNKRPFIDLMELNETTPTVVNQKLITRLRGKILLQVEDKGKAWYIPPNEEQRFYLADGSSAYNALRKFGLGITNNDLNMIPVGIEERAEIIDTDNDGLANKLEEAIGTDPNNDDTDGDGVSDMQEVELGKNPLGAGTIFYNQSLTNRLEGHIVLQVESRGEAWYIHEGKKFYMKDGDQAYQIMRFLSLGITNDDIGKISVGVLQ